MENKEYEDVFGIALADYLAGDKDAQIHVKSSLTEDDHIPVAYLFRDFDEMPDLEQKALDLVRGKVLDAGACAGNHALYLQDKNFDVVALDQSPGAVKVMQDRGVKKTVCSSLLEYTETGFDTLLILMNGTGLFEVLDRSGHYLQHLHKLLNTGGQILIDSTDIHYMFEEEDGSYWEDANKDYYGEVRFQLQYKNLESEPFNWIYLDYASLSQLALNHGFQSTLIAENNEHAYLARLVKV